MCVVLITIILFVCWLINKMWCFRTSAQICLVDKTALITGGASGIGFQAALNLAAQGCRIIIADQINLNEAIREIKERTHNTNIIGKNIQLESLKSVREFATDILATEKRLDILVCNAGIGDYRLKCVTVDGLERTMQINYFSHFLLTHLLMDLLKKSAPSRIIFSSSLTCYLSDLTVDNLNPEQSYFDRPFIKLNGGVYSNSKLALAAAARTFGEKLRGTGVSANAFHPGLVKTSIFQKAIAHDKNYLGLLFLVFTYIFGKSPLQGAQTLIHLAKSKEVKDVTGKYFIEGTVVPPPPRLSDELCQALWDESLKCVQLSPHEVTC